MKPELDAYLITASAISKLLHPFAEVVIHDLEQDQIVAIFNPISKRVVGDTSYLDRINFDNTDAIPNVIGPYEKLNYDGRRLKSISVVIRDTAGDAKGFLCINIDISIFTNYKTVLDAFLCDFETPSGNDSEVIFKDDLYEKINSYVQTYCIDNHLSLDTLSRSDKKDIIIKLKQNGALKGKNAGQYIARTLGVSRATVYNYLKTGENHEKT